MASTTPAISLLIADDDPVIRDLLRECLAAHGDFVILAECTNGEEAIALAKKHRPTVIVMDLDMPVMDGLQATEKVKQHDRNARIVVFSGTTTDELVDHAFACGAIAYVQKTSVSHLPTAIRAAAEGRLYLAPR